MQRNKVLAIVGFFLVVVLMLIYVIYGVVKNNDSENYDTRTFVNQTDVPSEDTSVVDIIAPSDTLITFLAEVSEAGLSERLRDDGRYTLFAPVDTAFGAEPLNDKGATIRNHIVDQWLNLEDLTPGRSIQTLSGQSLTVGKDGDFTTLQSENGTVARILSADTKARNGVVHVIDTVLK